MSHRLGTGATMTNFIGLLIIGFGVGWLLGMATTPVVSIVITSLTATAAALVAVLSGLQEARAGESTEQKAGAVRPGIARMQVAPIVALVIGIVLGASTGLFARTYGWFGTDLDAEINKWTKYGLSEEVVAAALFAAAYPAQANAAAPLRPWSNSDVGVLFGSAAELADACSGLLGLDDADLQKFARGSSLAGISRIAEAVADPPALRAVLEVLCSTE